MINIVFIFVWVVWLYTREQNNASINKNLKCGASNGPYFMVCKRCFNDKCEKRVNVKSDGNYINWKRAYVLLTTAVTKIMEVR